MLWYLAISWRWGLEQWMEQVTSTLSSQSTGHMVVEEVLVEVVEELLVE